MKRFLWIYFLSLTVFCGGYLAGSAWEASLGFPSIIWVIMGILTVVGAVGTLITVNIAEITEKEDERK